MRSFLAFTATLGLGVLAALIWLAPVWDFADLFRQFWAPLALAALLAAITVVIFGQKRQRWGAPLLALLVAAPGIPETLTPFLEVPLTPRSGTPFTVATHNAWGRNATVEAAAGLLTETNADVIALQETWGNAWPLPQLLRADYPNQAECDRYAVALVTRFEIVDSGCLDWWWWITREGAEDTPFFHAPPAAWATIRLPDGREITVASVHLTWPDPLRHQNEQREGLALMLQAFPRDRLIVMGDFNSASPSRALARIEDDLGLRRITHAMATWPSESMWAGYAGRTVTIPTMMAGIDHILVGGDFEDRAVERLPDTGSDHRPVMAHLTLVTDPNAD